MGIGITKRPVLQLQSGRYYNAFLLAFSFAIGDQHESFVLFFSSMKKKY